MEISLVFYPQHRAEWRAWLEAHHQSVPEVWVRTFLKASGKPSLPYDDMVEECLCFGWIDGVVKKYDTESAVRRITPRRKKSFLSEMNRQRVWKLQAEGLMTEAGLAPIASQLGKPDDPFEIPEWVVMRMQAVEGVWDTFQTYPKLYQRLKIAWVLDTAPNRAAEREKRLVHLMKMTQQGKRYGTEPLANLY